MPNTVTEIGEDAFALCDNLTKVKLSENLIQIPKGCFRYCKSVTDIELPKNIIKIGEYGFSNCISLKNIQIGDEVKYIETGCFECCEQLDSIILPATMEKLDNCFLQCGKLNKIYSYSEDPFNADFGLSLLTQSTLYVPRGSKIKYEAVYPWNGFKEIIEMDELGAVNEINGEILPDAPIIIYDSNGRLVSDSMEKLRKGIYIVKQGRLTKKIVVE